MGKFYKKIEYKGKEKDSEIVKDIFTTIYDNDCDINLFDLIEDIHIKEEEISFYDLLVTHKCLYKKFDGNEQEMILIYPFKQAFFSNGEKIKEEIVLKYIEQISFEKEENENLFLKRAKKIIKKEYSKEDTKSILRYLFEQEEGDIFKGDLLYNDSPDDYNGEILVLRALTLEFKYKKEKYSSIYIFTNDECKLVKLEFPIDNINNSERGNKEKEKFENFKKEIEKIEIEKIGTLQKKKIKEAMDELDSLIGLTKVKEEVKTLYDLMTVNKVREDMDLPVATMSHHLVFSGNPGTGKTTVARILAKIYKALGIIQKEEIKEVDRSELVAGYVGQTAIKTQEVLDSAKGGILFIDEAYTLAKKEDAFGQEAIDTILKEMEDNRESLVVIVAGYTDLMKDFIESNPGLKSRFNKYIEFEDYTPEELYKILELNCKTKGYEMEEEAIAYAKNFFEERYKKRQKNYANARDVRNFFEKAIINQSKRIVKEGAKDISKEKIMKIKKEDLENIKL